MTPDDKLKNVYWLKDGNWVHRPWWKWLINEVLMLAQWGSKRPWLIASKFEISGYMRPTKFVGYTFCRIPVVRKPADPIR